MKNLIICFLAAACANPLHIDLDVHIDVPYVESEKVSTRQGRFRSNHRKHVEADELPVVELPYEKHQASPPLTKDQKFYNFSNIPYAQQPVGNLRFKAAKVLEEVKGEKPMNDGQKSVICPQSQVGWLQLAEKFVTNFYATGGEPDPQWSYKVSAKDNYTWSSDIPPLPNMDESCLTLDVMVPKRLYDAKDTEDLYYAPVVVWFSGGGYSFGSKTFDGSPAGLFNASGQVEDAIFEDFIYVVSVNYRLGAFGWLAGKTFEDAGGCENAGLSDQVAALEWVENNIERFSGDPRLVTVMGQSAGASSIMHHLTAYGGQRMDRGRHQPPKFERAILQSPALLPIIDPQKTDGVYKTFLEAAGVKNFAELQKVDSKTLIRANSKTTYESPYGQFSYGPVLDNTYVVMPPILGASSGLLWNKQIMVSTNAAEGMLFTPPWVRSKEALKKYILAAYPSFVPEALETLLTELYVYPEGKTQKEKIELTAQMLNEFAVSCNALALTQNLPSYESYFNLLPGLHGQDLKYTYGPSEDPNVNEKQAARMRRYITSFVKWGSPNFASLDDDASWERYSRYDPDAMTFGTGQKPASADDEYGMKDEQLNAQRCEFWQRAPYWTGHDEAGSVINQLQLQSVDKAKYVRKNTREWKFWDLDL